LADIGKFNLSNIRQHMLKLKTHCGIHDLFLKFFFFSVAIDPFVNN
jgi:FMN phosphatase YigB (HAD superfamily)